MLAWHSPCWEHFYSLPVVVAVGLVAVEVIVVVVIVAVVVAVVAAVDVAGGMLLVLLSLVISTLSLPVLRAFFFRIILISISLFI